jgi:hypothetical protein
MKAHEWATKFNKAFGGEGDVFKTIDDFASECVKLIEERTRHSQGLDFVKSATEGAVRESRMKWKSIQGRCARLGSFGFDQIVKLIKKDAPDRTYRFVA